MAKMLMEETLSWNRALALTTACSLRIRGTESYSDHLPKSSSFSPAFKGPHNQAYFANCVTFSQVLLHKLSTAAKFLLTPNHFPESEFLPRNTFVYYILCVWKALLSVYRIKFYPSFRTQLNFCSCFPCSPSCSRTYPKVWNVTEIEKIVWVSELQNIFKYSLGIFFKLCTVIFLFSSQLYFLDSENYGDYILTLIVPSSLLILEKIHCKNSGLF